jgi:hypothetical protein
MASFPKLKTGAVAQYPASKTVQFRNQALRFVDGTEQRYRECASALHRWEIRLNALDESELALIESFFTEPQGRLGSFSFTDPWDGADYADCSLESDAMMLETAAELKGRTDLVIVENRN